MSSAGPRLYRYALSTDDADNVECRAFSRLARRRSSALREPWVAHSAAMSASELSAWRWGGMFLEAVKSVPWHGPVKIGPAHGRKLCRFAHGPRRNSVSSCHRTQAPKTSRAPSTSALLAMNDFTMGDLPEEVRDGVFGKSWVAAPPLKRQRIREQDAREMRQRRFNTWTLFPRNNRAEDVHVVICDQQPKIVGVVEGFSRLQSKGEGDGLIPIDTTAADTHSIPQIMQVSRHRNVSSIQSYLKGPLEAFSHGL